MSSTAKLTFTRVIRTASSERFLIQLLSDPEHDIAAVDVHYLDGGAVVATLILLSEDHASEMFIEQAVRTLDEQLLPMASISDGDLSFTVVQGRCIAQLTNMSDTRESE